MKSKIIKSKKQMFIVIGVFTLILLLGTTTYAFFNYTRTGAGNTIRVGRISFESKNEQTINLTNLFPIDPTDTSAMNDNTKVGTYSIAIKGDTDYSGGIEYLVSSVDSNIYTSTGKTVPLSLEVTVNGLGTSNANYFTARENTNASIYKKLVGDTLVGDQMLLVGFIKPNTTSGAAEGIDGSITIKAYLDENKILISDTYDGTESDNMGTPNSIAEGKTVLTTTEWNALSSSGLSFKVKVEANQGIWVTGSLEEIMRKSAVMDNTTSTFVSSSSGINFGAVSSDTNGKGVYMRAGTQNDAYPIMYYRGAVENNNVKFANKCWKTVRTTETGGVKLIYNGELHKIYNYTEQELSMYSNITKTDVQDVSVPFTYSNNTWNIQLAGATETEFEFTVPAGDDYIFTSTGTSGSTCGGTITFYKDGNIVNSSLHGGGQAMDLTYSYGSLTADNKIKMTFNGSSSTSCTINFKLKMEQNSTALAFSQYTVITNGLATSKKLTFDETEKSWSATVANGSTVKMTFNIASAGIYAIKYTNPGSGPFYIKKGETILTSASGTDEILDLGTVSTSDEYSIEYQQMATGSGTIKFTLMAGEYSGQDDCDNTGTDTQITLSGTNTFQFSGNNMYSSPAYVGYMWGTVYPSSTFNWTSNAKFGSSFTWDGTNYKLVDATVTTPNDTHHYSCNQADAEATCASIRYVFWLTGSTKYYITISDGKGIEEAMQDMQTNTTSSNAKTQIDTWYGSNMIGVTNKLEDTIWCNDRSIGRYNGWSSTGTINGSSSYQNYSLLFGASERSNYASGTSTVKNQPSLACTNKNDAFTVINETGNQKLQYPVAMLTEDEIVLAGGLAETQNKSFYLYNGTNYWSLSPSNFPYNNANGFRVDNYGYLSSGYVHNAMGLRPAVSLKPGTPVVSGTGTIADPYIIE